MNSKPTTKLPSLLSSIIEIALLVIVSMATAYYASTVKEINVRLDRIERIITESQQQ